MLVDVGSAPVVIALSPVDTTSRGHEYFHAFAGSQMACASCHPEGGDDGHAWRFDEGLRRTQSLYGGILATAPFHWNGDMQKIEQLFETVFGERMAGPLLEPEDQRSFARWLDSIPAMPAMDASSASAERGRVLFESDALECRTCHIRPDLSSPVSYDVGTGGMFQVPVLAGVAYRAPYLHDGCAETLHERFSDKCAGGDAHGRTSHLTPSQIDDLVAYLRTL
jgi:cytochrome c